MMSVLLVEEMDILLAQDVMDVVNYLYKKIIFG
jgi:hypothetical protein